MHSMKRGTAISRAVRLTALVIPALRKNESATVVGIAYGRVPWAVAVVSGYRLNLYQLSATRSGKNRSNRS